MPEPRITLLRIPARYEIDAAGERIGVAEFRLGPGPCGRTVRALRITDGAASLTVIQEHDDGTVVAFTYLHQHITGRIEATYA